MNTDALALEIEAVRDTAKQLDFERAGDRSPAARELALAITHLEDAEHRITRALELAAPPPTPITAREERSS